MVIAISHSTRQYRISTSDTYKWSRIRSNKNHRAEHLHLRDRAIAIEMEWAWLNSIWCTWVLLWSHDNIIKFDLYCQLSGSRSNSLNSWKLPGHFPYGLGTRLSTSLVSASLLRRVLEYPAPLANLSLSKKLFWRQPVNLWLCTL